eukprot:CAMPEP_0197418638 /NCGR_PEP_ID=MMETSP1170-20131217/4291_1 /TAXON_ID=54406 /ORGANISM="Sarcinochrysis sp, Strain CCMP770" /LENGTH=64 /DNA_ID=CAMNT_0042945689 /DNA_START=62 /DNA_END=253 /DNA_ORIENTATION=+
MPTSVKKIVLLSGADEGDEGLETGETSISGEIEGEERKSDTNSMDVTPRSSLAISDRGHQGSPA